MIVGAFIVSDCDETGKPKAFLGQGGWTQHKASALVFGQERDAKDWLEHLRKESPALLRGRRLQIGARPVDPGDALADQPVPRVPSDFDPFEAA